MIYIKYLIQKLTFMFFPVLYTKKGVAKALGTKRNALASAEIESFLNSEIIKLSRENSFEYSDVYKK